MSKSHRGKGLLKTPSRGRGTCPVCNSTRIKVLYSGTTASGETVKVCKRCQGKQAK